MKVQYKIKLIFFVKRVTVAVVDITDYDIQEIVDLLKIQKLFYPERVHKIRRF